MKKLYFTLIILLAAILPAMAGGIVYPENIKYSFNTKKVGNSLNIDLNISLDDVHIPGQGMLVLTPVLVGENKEYRLAPAVVAGSQRYKVINRLLAYDNQVFEQAPQVLTKYNDSDKKITLSYSVTFEKWMHGSDLYLYGNVSGCVNCGSIEKQHLVGKNIVPPIFIPEYRASYIVPEAEVKERSETFIARINYVVDRYELLPDFKNNATVLAEVDAVIKELQNDPDLTITHHTVTGYASPEGRFNSNITLSKNRAKSFMNFLQQKYNWNISAISHDGKGEDWAGLRKAVLERSDIPHRDEVISIIDNTSDITQRKRTLEALDGGRVYAVLLKDLYPPLRRNEFEVSYIVRAFNVEEARKIILTRPQLLNLNEMFLVANSYPKDSKNFKEVFDIAVRMYPDNPICKINAAAMEIETGSAERAIERLEGIDVAEAWNNLGIAHAKREEFDLARRYFQQAIGAGNDNAVHNLDQMNKTENNN